MPTTSMPKRTAVHRKLRGTVISAKMEKTIVVRVDRKVRHPKYGKIYTVSKKYKAHDEHGKAHAGDVVEITETRPISSQKRWRYLRTVTQAVNA